ATTPGGPIPLNLEVARRVNLRRSCPLWPEAADRLALGPGSGTSQPSNRARPSPSLIARSGHNVVDFALRRPSVSSGPITSTSPVGLGTPTTTSLAYPL